MERSSNKHNASGKNVASVKTLIFAAMAFIYALPASAHEFWMEPASYAVKAGDKIKAELRNGQYFVGGNLSYLPRNFREFAFDYKGEKQEITGTIGDRPAAKFTTQGEGLYTLSYITTESELTYQEWEKFMHFVEREGLIGTEVTHEAKGWPKEKFKEAYTRYVKSLVVAGDAGDDRDRALGQRFEVVVEGAPWLAESRSVDVQVLYEGKPFAGRLLSVYRKTGPENDNREVLTLDADGRATIERKDGGEMLIGAVQMIEASPEINKATGGALWHSLWASTTFEWLDK